jgi:anti-sigma B factor antagonist
MTSRSPVAVRQLPENFGAKNARIFLRELESCFTVDRPRVVLDCSKLTDLDSAGLRILLGCLEEAMMRNGDVKLSAITPEAATILRVTRIDCLFEVFENTDDAVGSFDQITADALQRAS